MRKFPVPPLIVTALALMAAFVSQSCGGPGPRTEIPKPPEVTESRVTFLAVGDIMISRGVARAIDRAGTPLAPFKPLEAVFKSTDFNFANLESPISGRNNVVGKGLVFNMRERDIEGLKASNFRVVTLANNHALDQGINGLRYTQKFLTDNGITYLGTGENLDEAWQPKTIEVKGVKIGFVATSYASVNDGGVARNDYVARMEDHARMRRAIDELRRDGADFIVATMHAGTEYVRRPQQPAIDFAHAAIDAGADVVIGHHPHWIQVFEEYKGKYIFYSLGNFIFDQEWSRDTKQGLAVKVSVHSRKSSDKPRSDTRVEQFELIPVVIENYSTPRLAGDAEAKQILDKIEAPGRVITPRQ